MTDIEFYKDVLAVCKSASSAKDEIIKSLKKENARLKELLGECQEFISERLDGLCGGDKDEILTEIKKVIK